MEGLLKLREKIANEKLIGKNRARHADPNGAASFPVPEYGPHDLNPPLNREIWNPPTIVREAGGGDA